jgi:hypothetical protein
MGEIYYIYIWRKSRCHKNSFSLLTKLKFCPKKTKEEKEKVWLVNE